MHTCMTCIHHVTSYYIHISHHIPVCITYMYIYAQTHGYITPPHTTSDHACKH